MTAKAKLHAADRQVQDALDLLRWARAVETEVVKRGENYMGSLWRERADKFLAQFESTDLNSEKQREEP